MRWDCSNGDIVMLVQLDKPSEHSGWTKSRGKSPLYLRIQVRSKKGPGPVRNVSTTPRHRSGASSGRARPFLWHRSPGRSTVRARRHDGQRCSKGKGINACCVLSCRHAPGRNLVLEKKQKAGPGGVRARNPPVRSAANFQEKVNCGKYSVARAGDPGSPGARVVACAQLKCRQAAMGIRQPPDRQVGNSSKTTDLERARTRPVRAINPTGIDGAAQQWQGRPPAG